MFLRRLGKRGTAIVEYAIILAFAAAVGSSFTSDNGMTGSIKSIIGNVNQMLGVAAGKEESKGAVSENAKQLTLKLYAVPFPKESGKMSNDYKQVGEEFTIDLK